MVLKCAEKITDHFNINFEKNECILPSKDAKCDFMILLRELKNIDAFKWNSEIWYVENRRRKENFLQAKSSKIG